MNENNGKNEKKQTITMWIATALIVVLIGIIVSLYVRLVVAKRQANIGPTTVSAVETKRN